MPHVFTNGIRLSYERSGRGERVLMIMGSSAAGRVWTLHQTPALNEAGYQAITFDNRGIAPSDIPPGKYTIADMVADTKGLIEALDAAPCRIVGVSLGAMIAQELAISHPELVRCAVLIATKSRSDALRAALGTADRALMQSGVKLPPDYEAAMSVLQMLSPATLRDDSAVSLWLETFRLAGAENSIGQTWINTDEDRRKKCPRRAASSGSATISSRRPTWRPKSPRRSPNAITWKYLTADTSAISNDPAR
ncbi:alpha/beta fold hydrolase [Streptomyces ortus]|uniref:Alpha/beta hydrolase n=1 Tax=Streptomyces ortus TaxID=2867268 RepID=A0ABT3UUN8_9ACTN|nr:alpha/beta hydrolase [Streptomyces ortus]MCX4231272.1 alpha/beta hydrolase [Streptomyces ortus]